MRAIQALSAIQIGINNKEWDYMYEGDPLDACIEFMSNKKYDILPLKNKQGMFNNFLVTDEWNHYDKIKQVHKSNLPKIKAEIKFLELLQAFIHNKEKYFLLYKGSSVVGLISISNFSYREIYNGLYDIMAELEMLLAKWVFNIIDKEEVLQILLNRSNSDNTKSVLGQYLIDQKKGVDGPLKEYLFLSSLHSIIKEGGLYFKIGFQKKEWNELGNSLFETRNSIAHPVRAIIREKNDFKRVQTFLLAAKKILSHIEE